MEQPAPQTNLIGATVGNYKVVSKLGEGGMGSVYLAEHPLIGKKVALKVLHQEFASNDEVVSRFFTEARSVNNIQHPNIVDIVDYGVIPSSRPHEAGMVYFIMEFLDGESLSSVIHRESPLPPERSLRIALQVADALGASHTQKIVHRDLKPDNIMLVVRGRDRDFCKVLDFGIAKLTGDQPGSRRTRTGIVMGTPAYMSPEQCEGRGDIDHRTDIYALGIVLYEMVTGRVPFVGNGYGEVLVQHLTQKPARPSTVRGVIPPHVEAIILKALEKNPNHRFPNMDEFTKALIDPVGYVEAHGGLAGFLATDSLAAAGPDSSRRATMVAPGMGGSSSVVTPMPQPPPGYGQKPTTLSGGTGEMSAEEEPRRRSRTPIYAAVAAAVVVFAGLGIFAMGGGGDSKSAKPTGGEVTPPPAGGDKPTPPTGDKPTPPTGDMPTGDKVAVPTGDKPTGDKPVTPTGDTPTGDKPPVVENLQPTGDKPTGDTPVQPVAKPTVTAKVNSKPAGADVYVGSEAKPRCKTPCEVKIEVSKDDVPFTLKLDGYEDFTKTVAPDQNRTLEWELKAKPAAAKPPTGERRQPTNRPPRNPRRRPGDPEILVPEL